jgi:hypothetical protein
MLVDGRWSGGKPGLLGHPAWRAEVTQRCLQTTASAPEMPVTVTLDVMRLEALALASTLAAFGCTASSSPNERPGAAGTATNTPGPPALPSPMPQPPNQPSGPARGVGLDEDDVVKLYPDASGTPYHLGASDLNADARIALEQEGSASSGLEGSLHFWTVSAYSFEYSEDGEMGKTARVHISGESARQRFDWQTQMGFLAGPDDLGDQEFTAYVRVHGIFDPEHAVFELKIRGGDHSDQTPPLASCTLMTFATASAPSVSHFGKELDHPLYDYVNLPLRFSTELGEGRWYGLKLVSYADPARPDRVVNRLYVDDDPFTSDGTPRNAFRLLTEYIDRAGVSTGRYDTLVNWRGLLTTLRVDGVDSLDVALLSARPIAAPAGSTG